MNATKTIPHTTKVRLAHTVTPISSWLLDTVGERMPADPPGLVLCPSEGCVSRTADPQVVHYCQLQCLLAEGPVKVQLARLPHSYPLVRNTRLSLGALLSVLGQLSVAVFAGTQPGTREAKRKLRKLAAMSFMKSPGPQPVGLLSAFQKFLMLVLYVMSKVLCCTQWEKYIYVIFPEPNFIFTKGFYTE